MTARLFIVSLLATAFAFAPAINLTNGAEPTTKATTITVAKTIEITGVHNAFRVTEKIYSGSQPEGDAAFAALAKLGVKPS